MTSKEEGLLHWPFRLEHCMNIHAFFPFQESYGKGLVEIEFFSCVQEIEQEQGQGEIGKTNQLKEYEYRIEYDTNFQWKSMNSRFKLEGALLRRITERSQFLLYLSCSETRTLAACKPCSDAINDA